MKKYMCFILPHPHLECCLAPKGCCYVCVQIRSDQISRSVVSWLFATPWIAARQASLSITNSRSSLRLTSIESVIPSSHLILCRPLLLLPPIPPSIRVFSNESTLRMSPEKNVILLRLCSDPLLKKLGSVSSNLALVMPKSFSINYVGMKVSPVTVR